MAGDLARGATAYVTLEPCNHWGQSPPCTEALIAAGIARVVIGATDPDPRVDGTGIAACAAVTGHSGMYGFSMTWAGVFTTFDTGNCVLPTT